MDNPRFPVILAALAVIASASGCSRESSAETMPLPPESWAERPREQWPLLVLVHEAQFRGHTALEGCSACLVELEGGRVIAATAGHVLEEEAGVSPPVKVGKLHLELLSWKLHPREQPDASVRVTGLFGRASAYEWMPLDCLLLSLARGREELPAKPLHVRHAPLAQGEVVYLVGPYGGEPIQNVHAGKVGFVNRNGLLGGQTTDPGVELSGFSGAPLIDRAGHLAAIVVGGLPGKKGKPSTFLAVQIAKVLKTVKE